MFTERGQEGERSAIIMRFCRQALMHPAMRQVIPLAPEGIKNTDGTTKQDCEIQAAKRLVKRIRRDHPKLRIIIVAEQFAQ